MLDHARLFGYRRIALGAWMLIACGLAGPLTAQISDPSRQLPVSVITSEQPTTAERQRIEAYVKHWVGRLVAGQSRAQVTEGRDQLLRPMRNPLAKGIFKSIYGGLVAVNLRPGIEHEQLLTRLNTLIVAAVMPDGNIAKLAELGLADPNPAVRYWAAKAAADVAAMGNPADPMFDEEQQQGLLAALSRAMPEERDQRVLRQMYRALGGLTLPEARAAVLRILARRIDLHRGGLSEALRADQEGMANIKTQLLVAEARGQDVTAQLRQLTIAAAHYLQIIAHELQQGRVDETVTPYAVSMIATIEEVFRFAVERFAPGQAAGPPLQKPAKAQAYDELLLNTYEWVGTRDKAGLLSESAINIPFEQLQLSPADKSSS